MLPSNHPLAALEKLVDAEDEVIARGEPCPRCHSDWKAAPHIGVGARELDHHPLCRHIWDCIDVDAATLELELAP